VTATVQAQPPGGAGGMKPTVWDHVIGHDDVVRTLREALDTGRVAHAWLFTGPPGVGKSFVARLLAAALNCENTRGSDADGTCLSCRRVLRGVHPDVHHIEPEGEQLRVEEVRAVREEAWHSRREGRTAVFILEQADRMNDNAANALLKVLEEPPAGVVFVLVAPSAATLVGTVPSRARVLTFAELPQATLAAGLAREPGVNPELAAWAAAAAHGRLGRARELLTDEAARARRDRVLDLLESLVTGSAADALGAADVIARVGEEAAAALRDAQVEELAALEEVFGRGRGTAAMRRRMEARHKRTARRVRFDAVREAVNDLLGACRDVACQHAGSTARLVHPDRADQTAALAARIPVAAALRAAAALEEADRRLSIGAAVQLTCETALLAAHAALTGQTLPLKRVDLRR
jgi:DNA polymerase III subunit delta'